MTADPCNGFLETPRGLSLAVETHCGQILVEIGVGPNSDQVAEEHDGWWESTLHGHATDEAGG